MYFEWEDRINKGRIDSFLIFNKPSLSFDYAWILITDDTAQYVESHGIEFENKAMSEDQENEVINYYNNYIQQRNSVPVNISLEDIKGRLLIKLSEKRWQIETGGMKMPDGMKIETDDRSKILITGAFQEALLDSAYTTKFKTKTGWVELNAEQIIAIGRALSAHTKACFLKEEELADEILNSDDPENIDIESGWPGG